MRNRLIATSVFVVTLAACGGGGGGGGGGGSGVGVGSGGGGNGGGGGCGGVPAQPLALMVDSLGRTIPDTDTDFGGGDSGAAGADGSAGDGAPIANAPVALTDSAGRTVSGTTDALGYYRLSIKGMTSPFVVRVQRPDGSFWYSASTTPVTTRCFVTINITGLTDKVSNYVADAASLSGGAAAVTPAVLAGNTPALPAAIAKVNTGLTAPMVYAGLDPATFNAVATPYQAAQGDKYDFLLDRLSIGRVTGNKTVVVGTLAGVQESFTNGPLAVATFGRPSGVAFDSSGNMYVADQLNQAIRKITAAGVVSTLAGGKRGFNDGTGTAAQFNFLSNLPVGIAVDRGGNIFVPDGVNHTIRKVSPAGVVTTFAGDRNGGRADGTGTAARFLNPTAIALDASDNLYVADSSNHLIRKVTPNAVVTTVAGSGLPGFTDGAASVASFNFPCGVALDSLGNVFVIDRLNYAIRRIAPNGTVTTHAGSGSNDSVDNTGLAASFMEPRGLAADSSGDLYVAELTAIRKVTSTGVVTTLAGGKQTGGFADGTGVNAKFLFPLGVALDGGGNVIVADTYNNAVRQVTAAGVATTLAGKGGSSGYAEGTGTSVRFNFPLGVALDSSRNLYVADAVNGAIRRITPAGVVSTFVGGSAFFVDATGGPPEFSGPHGVAIDVNNNVYVADKFNHSIRKVTPAGVVTTLAGSGSPGFSNGTGRAATFNGPEGVAVDGSGNVYVADTDNNAIRKITPAGVVSTLAGDGSAGLINGPGASARFFTPRSLVVGSGGNVYVADEGNNAIRKITSNGNASTVAGGTFCGGNVPSSVVCHPFSVAIDAAGNLYVANTGRNAILVIDTTGATILLAGGNDAGYANGTVASFNSPRGIAVDGNGVVYVSDTENNVIRIVLP